MTLNALVLGLLYDSLFAIAVAFERIFYSDKIIYQ